MTTILPDVRDRSFYSRVSRDDLIEECQRLERLWREATAANRLLDTEHRAARLEIRSKEQTIKHLQSIVRDQMEKRNVFAPRMTVR